MKNFHLKTTVAVAVMAWGLCVVGARAAEGEVTGTPGAHIASQDGSNEHVALLGSDSSSGDEAPPNAADALEIDHSTLDARTHSLNQDGEEAGSTKAASTDREPPPLAPFALPHVNLDLSGAEGSAAMPGMALGPQYGLASNVTVGGTREARDIVAFGADADDGLYTFGLRITF